MVVRAAGVEFDLIPKEVRLLRQEPFTVKEMKRAGYGMAKLAATGMGAPRDTGKGANSIRGQLSGQPGAAPAEVDVSWGQRYYYMIFHHDGWAPTPGGPRKPANPFLRRAFETYALF